MTNSQPFDGFLALHIGNSRARLGVFRGADLHDPVSILLRGSEHAAVIEEIVSGAAKATEQMHDARVVLASVNDPVAEEVETRLRRVFGEEVYRIGRDLDIPIAKALDDDSTVGQDRLLCALAAYARAEQACVVVDAGTAITVDFVDGEGTFQGGVIAPGLRMMLEAMHEKTAALPMLAFELPPPSRGPFGKDTAHAMRLGVVNMARGLVRRCVEEYADAYGAYPQIVATGGDAPALFESDDLVEHIVPDLQLMGIAEACRRTLSEGNEAEEDA